MGSAGLSRTPSLSISRTCLSRNPIYFFPPLVFLLFLFPVVEDGIVTAVQRILLVSYYTGASSGQSLEPLIGRPKLQKAMPTVMTGISLRSLGS